MRVGNLSIRSRVVVYSVLFAIILFHILVPMQFVRVTGKSMEPNLADGTLLIANHKINSIQRGDMVIAQYDHATMIKRVVYLPGDQITLLVDDPFRMVLNSYDNDKIIQSLKKHGAKTYTFIVPNDEYYLLGDNTEYSYDSRYFGAVPKDSIVAKVVQ